MLSKVFEVIEMPQEVQQKMYSAKDGEELTAASDAFIAGITERVRYLESGPGEERELYGRREEDRARRRRCCKG